MELTAKERSKLLIINSVPPNIQHWAMAVGRDPNPTEQQILTVRQIFDLSVYERNLHWIFEDKLRLKPESILYQRCMNRDSPRHGQFYISKYGKKEYN
tara:strand:- start:191 stop:484 length:294 start_codon:yes stop_codon:yes gene_type:complete